MFSHLLRSHHHRRNPCRPILPPWSRCRSRSARTFSTVSNCPCEHRSCASSSTKRLYVFLISLGCSTRSPRFADFEVHAVAVGPSRRRNPFHDERYGRKADACRSRRRGKVSRTRVHVSNVARTTGKRRKSGYDRRRPKIVTKVPESPIEAVKAAKTWRSKVKAAEARSTQVPERKGVY